jgi:DNA-binding response OmpR family regulator
MKILIVEDHKELASHISDYLKKRIISVRLLPRKKKPMKR